MRVLAITFFQQFDKLIVGFTLGPVLAGVYSIGTSLALRISMVTGQATEVMVPYASLQESLDAHQKLYAIFRRLSHYVSLLVAGISSILIIWMNEILSLWISPGFAAHYANGFRILDHRLRVDKSLPSCAPDLDRHRQSQVHFTRLSLSTILMLTGTFFLSKKFGFWVLPGPI